MISSGPINGTEQQYYGDHLSRSSISEIMTGYKVKKGDQGRPMLPVQDYHTNEKGNALADTGADINTVTNKRLRKLEELSGRKYHLKDSNRELIGFDGKQTKPLGKARLKLKIGDSTYDDYFTVISSDSGPDYILGTPWLSKIGVLQNLKNDINEKVSSKNM